MNLQILVNHYKEDKSIVERFLYSLVMQRGVDFSVIICSDGADELDTDFLSKFNLKIQYAYLPHSGVCHTRNVLLDKSDADYVMFADIDDCFHASDGLLSLVEAAEKTDADVIASPFITEVAYKYEFIYNTYPRDTVRVHGKLFKRSYLIENDIRFPDELETSGDMMFTWLCFSLTKNIVWVKNNFYMWKHNPNSVTRGVEYESVYHYPRTIKCYMLLAEDLKRRQREDLFKHLILTLIPMFYLDKFDIMWMNAPKEYVEASDRAVVKCLDKYFGYYKDMDIESRKKGYEAERKCKPNSKPKDEFDGVIEWCEQLMIQYGDTDKECDERSVGDVLIIGCGVVGSNLAAELKSLNPAMYDKYKDIDSRYYSHKIAFVCVDTPKTDDVKCDISEVKNAILENDADIYVIKSTVLPGTTEQLAKQTGKHIVFSPEYYGGTQHCNNYNFDYTILGGEKEDCARVIQMLEKAYDGRHQFRITDYRTAELVKYMENSYLATKVSFCQQFYRIASELGVTYEELRELFVLDPRVNPSHTFVYADKPYWESHCLDKDVPAIADAYDADFLKAVIDYNEKCKF